MVLFWFRAQVSGFPHGAAYSIASFSIALLLVKKYERGLRIRKVHSLRRNSQPGTDHTEGTPFLAGSRLTVYYSPTVIQSTTGESSPQSSRNAKIGRARLRRERFCYRQLSAMTRTAAARLVAASMACGVWVGSYTTQKRDPTLDYRFQYGAASAEILTSIRLTC